MKFVSLLSSGIDSPVATYLISQYADEMVVVHGDIRPFTDDREIANFKKLLKQLKKVAPCKFKAHLLPHGSSLYEFKEICKSRFTCVFCKRMLLRYAEKIAEKENASAIIMGDSLGQVASQTLQNIRTIEEAISIPVLRPLIGLDKEDVVRIAKRIGTYNLSILPSIGCDAVPNKPATRAKLEDVLSQENKIDVEDLVIKAIKNSKLINI